MTVKLFDPYLLPMYFGATMSVFEGNGIILNFYSEIEKPKEYLSQVIWVLSICTFFGIFYGSISYFAYGENVKGIILYNLSDSDSLAVLIKVLYMLTIMGVYVIIIMPV